MKLLDKLYYKVAPNIYSQELPNSQLLVNKMHNSSDNEDLDSSSILNIDALNELTTLGNDRSTRYEALDMMRRDATISSALEIYADDCTPYNEDGFIIWAEPNSLNNQDIDSNEIDKAVQAVNRLLKVLQINENSWSYIYSLCTYGDLYLQTFTVSDIFDICDNDKYFKYRDISIQNINTPPEGKIENTKLSEHIEMVHNPAEIYDLTVLGKTAGFVKISSPLSRMANGDRTIQSIYTVRDSSRIIIDSPTKYIHICLEDSIDRYPMKLKLFNSKNSEEDSDANGVDYSTYTVKSGKSILEDVYKVSRELNLLEQSLLFNRVSRSAIIRILEIDVGAQSTANARNMIRRVKQTIEQKLMMNTDTGFTQSYASPGPMDNIIYVPVRGDTNRINSTTLGGDVDVKSISDIDYFSNKLYAGLKIPKQYLGVSTDENGMVSNGTSLTKVDIRYARTIKRIQSAYIAGITALINTFLYNKKLDSYVGLYKLKMVSPSSIEETERLETQSSKIDLYDRVLQIFNSLNLPDEETREAVSIVLQTLGEVELADIVNNYSEEPEVSEDEFTDDMEDAESSSNLQGVSPASPTPASSTPEYPTAPDDLFGDSDTEGFNDYQSGAMSDES